LQVNTIQINVARGWEDNFARRPFENVEKSVILDSLVVVQPHGRFLTTLQAFWKGELSGEVKRDFNSCSPKM
jgi:hypothetical protein